MSRLDLDALQAIVDDPAGILSDAEIATYIALSTAKAESDAKLRADALAEAAAERKRVAALRGANRIKHVLARQKRSA